MRPFTHRVGPLALLLAVAIAPAAAADTLTERYEETFEVAPGVQIDLRNTNGAIEIDTWSRDAVEVIAIKTVRSRDDDSARQALEDIRIRIDASSDRLDIETELPRGSNGVLSWLFGRHVSASVEYELRIPDSARLDVVTVNGSVYSDGTAGPQRLRSTNGRITVDAARTTNGSIELELTAAASDTAIEASTTNGSITVRVPGDLAGSLEARTINGSVRSDLPVKLSGGASKRRIDADLNGGGPARIELRTTNGSIRIRES